MNGLLARIACEIAASGGRALLVGGCVRDSLLGTEATDIDCEVHGLDKEALLSILTRFGNVDRSGEPFGVFTLQRAHIDFALSRVERRTGVGHTDFTVTPMPDLSPARAAARRDFTVNAIMRDALTGEIIDPYGGEDDLKNGVLRAVPGGQFEEDPLRVLRGAQFAARLHLSPDKDTLEMMRRMPLGQLSRERVMGEMKKALVHSDAPDVFFRVLRDADALLPWFSEVHALIGVPQNPVYHPEGDVFEHTMLVLREAAGVRKKAENPLDFMLAALTHDLGKAVTTKKSDKGAWQSLRHETEGLPLISSFLGRLGAGRQAEAYCRDICRLHMRVHTCYYGKARTSRTNLLFDESGYPRDLALLCVCDARGTGKPRENADAEEAFVFDRLQLYEAAAAQKMPSGRDFMDAGAAPGPEMKTMIVQARRYVLQGMTYDRAIAEAMKNIRKEL